MSKLPKPNRRWLHFSLRTLLALLTLLCVVTGWVAWNFHQVQERKRFLESVEDDPKIFEGFFLLVGEEPRMPMMWSLLGAQRQDYFNLSRDRFSDDDIRRARSLFPEAGVRVYQHDADIPDKPE